MSRLMFMSAVAAALVFGTGVALAGVAYPDPGWTYIYTGDAAVPGPNDDFDSLDGTWDHDNDSDEWDGTEIGEGYPGGASALDGFLRLQETGDPRDYDMDDPSNRKLYFAHDITPEAGTTILDDGVTLSFRARLATAATGPVDDLYPNGGGGPLPWPAGGDGYYIHDKGKGNFGIHQDAGGTISFALALASDHENLGGLQGLVMNRCVGTSISGDVDVSDDEPPETLNILEIDDLTVWHEFWITIEQDDTGTGTHKVTIWMDGDIANPSVFIVTAGSGREKDYDDKSYLAMGVGSTGQSGAIDIDFFAYKPGVIAAIPEPATLAMLALGGLGLAARRRRS